MSDLISRQAAIKWCLEGLNNMASAEQERKTVRWISDWHMSIYGVAYVERRCSECESYYQDVGYGWNYCPNCGADMRGEEE